ncbi:hypothetical protein LZ012_01100 [Dechloromonas sp. XY25]|uniref:Ni,Fe-hydrogenase I large subunit n=1 Tax=Dechloromonas hankyongensis TaxID=2908002 RepID=A0ABS9JXE9_9RHOO|nr:hypothetical protein [Dechloromonas hankyongensis]MCG2575586.1 hypothetical protein [Dechloromonas hankyongensis]
MTSAGQLLVRATYADEALRDIVVDLQRPSVTRLFIGQLPDVVIKTVPYLFTLCAHAQRVAAQAAVNVALGETPRTPDHAELWIEVLHENLWRLLLDWPPAVGLPPAKDAFIAWRGSRNGDEVVATTRRLTDEVVKPLAADCLALLEVAAGDGDQRTQRPAVLAPESWLDYWQGMRAQMPALPLPDSIPALYRARLAEVDGALAALVEHRPFPIASAGGAGWGVGQTLTARGVLTHAVHVVDGEVVRYRVQAPTDSLFADARPLAGLLANRRFVTLDQARQGMDQAILALDPCLPYTVELQDA